MSRLKSMVGWTLRGGDQTRAEFATQAEAIRELQQRVAEIHELVDGQVNDGQRLQAEVRGVLADLTERIVATSDRLDGLDRQLADHDALLSSISRVIAPPTSH
jgi:uncharacterized protein involved in exopolysaccharide biosynthesis